MCLLIFKPAGQELAEAELREGFRCNSHGAGFGFYDTELRKYFLNKGFWTFESFYAQYKEFVKKDHPAIVHFRIATHGKKNQENCHPHFVGGGWLMGHNGCIGGTGATYNGELSDSATFGRDELLKWFDAKPNAPLDKGIQEKITARIGTGNKLVFLNCHGQHVIINEGAGEWHNGSWFSNGSYKVTSRVFTENKKGGGASRQSSTGCSTTTSFGGSKKVFDGSELYEELIEINVGGGCASCKAKFGSADKTFQWNQYTGECYCNDCVFGVKAHLLYGNPIQEVKADPVDDPEPTHAADVIDTITAAEEAINVAEKLFEEGEISSRDLGAITKYAEASTHNSPIPDNVQRDYNDIDAAAKLMIDDILDGISVASIVIPGESCVVDANKKLQELDKQLDLWREEEVKDQWPEKFEDPIEKMLNRDVKLLTGP